MALYRQIFIEFWKDPKVTEEKELKRYDKCRCNAIYDTSPTAD